MSSRNTDSIFIFQIFVKCGKINIQIFILSFKVTSNYTFGSYKEDCNFLNFVILKKFSSRKFGLRRLIIFLSSKCLENWFLLHQNNLQIIFQKWVQIVHSDDKNVLEERQFSYHLYLKWKNRPFWITVNIFIFQMFARTLQLNKHNYHMIVWV